MAFIFLHSSRLHAWSEIGVALREGYPLVRAIEGTGKRLSRTRYYLTQLRNQLGKGASFSEAAEKAGKLFPRRYRPYLKEGDRIGLLQVMFSLMQDCYIQDRNMRWARIRIILYPLIFGALISFNFWIYFTFSGSYIKKIIIDLGLTMPMQFHFEYFYLLAVSLGILSWITLPLLGHRLWFHQLHEAAPVVGRGFRNLFWSKFVRVLGRLLSEGISVPEAVKAAGRVAGKDFLTKSAERISAKTGEGERLSTCLKSEGIYPESIIWTASQGELTGNLPEAFSHLADRFEKSGKMFSQRSLQIIELILIVILVLSATLGVIGIYQGIFKLSFWPV